MREQEGGGAWDAHNVLVGWGIRGIGRSYTWLQAVASQQQ